MEKIPCPFVYSSGKRCTGHIVRIEAYNARVDWTFREPADWRFGISPRSHFYLFCSMKSNQAGHVRSDDPQTKFYWDQLPEAIQEIIAATEVGGRSAETGGSPPAPHA